MFAEFSKEERRNLIFYIIGIMIYKFALETMNACINGIVLNRLPKNQGSGATWANMQGLNLACQCIGSLIIGPLVKRFHAKNVIATAILLMGLTALLVPVLELTSGGKIPQSAGSNDAKFWGNFSPYILYSVYPLLGIFHGMVELMRRVIPADIVGGDAVKLKKMDGTVHVFYEITGTTGAVLAIIWINFFGWGYALALLPIGFTISFLSWLMITPRAEKIVEIEQYKLETKDVSMAQKITEGFYSFFHSIYFGAKLVCTQRALVWLLPAYTLPLVLHRYLENTLFPFYTKGVLGSSNYQTILTAGSNFGELLGALLVVLVAKKIKTPIPFLRLDVLLLLFIWILPFFPVDKLNPFNTTWQLFPIMAIISSGWAAGDVSLAAYVQSRLNDYASIDKYTTPLGAVMSFLYVTYLVAFYVLNLLMSLLRDDYDKNGKSKTELFMIIGGGFMTISGVIVMISTFIPRGSFAWNPDPDTVEFDEEIDLSGVPSEGKVNGEKDKVFS
jgi:MFS family permease